MGAKVVDADDVIGTECDVFSPCATGKVLTEDDDPTPTVPDRRRCCEQPARRRRGRRAPPRRRHPVRARLRDQRGRRDPPRRLRDPGVGRRDDGEAAGSDRRHVARDLRTTPTAKGSRPRPPPTAWLAPASPPPADDRVIIRALGPEDADACDGIVGGLPYHFAQAQGQARLCCRGPTRPRSRRHPGRRGRGFPHVRASIRRSGGDHLDGGSRRSAAPWDRPCADRPARRGDSAPKGRRVLLVLTVSPSDPGAEAGRWLSVRREPSTARRASCWDATCAGSGIPTPPCSWCGPSLRSGVHQANGFSWPASARPTTYRPVKSARSSPRRPTRATPPIRPGAPRRRG